MLVALLALFRISPGVDVKVFVCLCERHSDRSIKSRMCVSM